MSQHHGIFLKKKFGQHFLRDRSIVQRMCKQVALTADSSVFEIGCGDGVLTQEILTHPLQRLWVFEIDPEWADYVRRKISDARVTIFEQDFLTVDLASFEPDKPWILLANLPYQITFPLLFRLHEYRHLLAEGVIMMQEEVAQKIMRTTGRGYGFPSLFFQYYFEWQMLEKISPQAFSPPPKIFSRLLYFKPRQHSTAIPHEQEFWKFIKFCFGQPRRTLRNNLISTHYFLPSIPAETLQLRAQQMSMKDLLQVWDLIHPTINQSE
jgi:16S rRNA (adenine1518-N6/adenine1519-N6)-dimethyltransferase